MQNVAANISGLAASTTYHFRIVATNSRGTSYSGDRTFTTLPSTGSPVVTTNPASNLTTSAATLRGLLDPHGLTTTVRFQYGTTTRYGHATAMQTQTGNTYRNIVANIGGLNTHYLSFSNRWHEQRRDEDGRRQDLYYALAALRSIAAANALHFRTGNVCVNLKNDRGFGSLITLPLTPNPPNHSPAPARRKSFGVRRARFRLWSRWSLLPL